MQSLTQPELLLKPFAENGDKNEIPVENQTISQPQLADLTNGFPEITSKDPSDGGLPPERKDFNALGYLTTSYDYFYQAGGTFTFSQAICDAIGGYPQGSRLWYTNQDGLSCILRSTIPNNTNNFLEDESVIGDAGSGSPWEVENFRGIINEQSKPLFDFKFADHLLYDISWLRADTFSWQSGLVYDSAYKHLVQDVEQSKITYYAWQDNNDEVVYTKSEEPSVGDISYTIDGTTVNEDSTVTTYDSENLYIVDGNSTTYYRYDDGDTSLLNPKTETISGYTITYYQAPDGHKITTDEDTVFNIFNATGIAWYYVLDTVNTRFKLPRTKYGFTGLRDAVGKYVTESLPNITGSITGQITGVGTSATSKSGVFSKSQENSSKSGANGSNYRVFANLSFDASDSSSTYKDNAPVQQRATQMYLYFYVGQFTQSATEQTAGLNTELFARKVDLDAGNLSNAGKSLLSGFGMPSDNYESLTLGASGSTYTAPANGWFYFGKVSGAAKKYIELKTDNLGIQMHSVDTNDYMTIFIPVKKDDVVYINYNATGNTTYLRFVYAEGEPNV